MLAPDSWSVRSVSVVLWVAHFLAKTPKSGLKSLHTRPGRWTQINIRTFTGHDPTRRSGQRFSKPHGADLVGSRDFEISRGRSGWVKMFRNLTGRVGLGQRVLKSWGSGRNMICEVRIMSPLGHFGPRVVFFCPLGRTNRSDPRSQHIKTYYFLCDSLCGDNTRVDHARPCVKTPPIFCFLFRTLLLSSSWTSRGHRCRPFSPPILAFIFYRVQGSAISLLVDFSSSVVAN